MRSRAVCWPIRRLGCTIGGQPGGLGRVDRHVIKARDRQIVRDVQTPWPERWRRRSRREYRSPRISRWVVVRRAARAVPACTHAPPGRAQPRFRTDPRLIDDKALFLHHPAITREPFFEARESGDTDEANAPMAEAGQVGHHLFATHFAVGADQVGVETGERAVKSTSGTSRRIRSMRGPCSSSRLVAGEIMKPSSPLRVGLLDARGIPHRFRARRPRRRRGSPTCEALRGCPSAIGPRGPEGQLNQTPTSIERAPSAAGSTAHRCGTCRRPCWRSMSPRSRAPRGPWHTVVRLNKNSA